MVIEPHMDDAALGVGGLLLHRRGRCRITILSVVTWSNFTAYLKLDLANVLEITKLRQQESASCGQAFRSRAALLGLDRRSASFLAGRTLVPSNRRKVQGSWSYFCGPLPERGGSFADRQPTHAHSERPCTGRAVDPHGSGRSCRSSYHSQCMPSESSRGWRPVFKASGLHV